LAFFPPSLFFPFLPPCGPPGQATLGNRGQRRQP
jgi:hypothetical protein